MKNRKLLIIITVISSVAAVCAALTAFFIIRSKQREAEVELDAQLNDDLIA